MDDAFTPPPGFGALAHPSHSRPSVQLLHLARDPQGQDVSATLRGLNAALGLQNRTLRAALSRAEARSAELETALHAWDLLAPRLSPNARRLVVRGMPKGLPGPEAKIVAFLRPTAEVAVARAPPPASTAVWHLTPRQAQILRLVLEGHPNKIIAADLGISQRTVENHRAAIMQRTGATSLAALVRMAFGMGRNDDCR